MAGELSITASEVALVRKMEYIEGVAGEAITAGQLVFVNSSGKLMKAAASSAGALGYRLGIALRSVAANRPLTALAKGLINLGLAPLSAVNPGAPIYASDTAGSIATSAGTVTKIIGQVEAVWGRNDQTYDKILRVDL